MTQREKLFARVREALRAPGPQAAPSDSGATAEVRDLLPAPGATPEEWLARFAANCAELRAEFHVADDETDARRMLRTLAAESGWKTVASHRGALTGPAVESLKLPALFTDGGFDVQQLETCDAGITECDALIAQPGSVLVTSASAGGRALSVLPPHHVVLARREQLLPDLPAAYELLSRKYGGEAGRWPGMISFITGPSRTGDIERILVLGAHGPKRLSVILW